MLYMVFFLLRDGGEIGRRVRARCRSTRRTCCSRSSRPSRATVKGNIAVALVQGALGGLIFWILGIEGVVLGAR